MTPLQQLTQQIATASTPDQALMRAMTLLCDLLRCDRCFLYLRNPETAQGRVTHCHCVDERWPDLRGASWLEAKDIAPQDPLMAIACQTSASVFVDDIETASAEVINREYERQEFGHRALIHTPLYCKDRLIGILELCVFEQPRQWLERDRSIVAIAQSALTPVVEAYLTSMPFLFSTP